MIDVQATLSESAGTFYFPEKQEKVGIRTKKLGFPASLTPSSVRDDFLFPVQKPEITQEQEAPLAGTISKYVPARSYFINAQVNVRDSAKPMLTDRMQRILTSLYPLLDRAARRYGVQVRKVIVGGYVDPEEDHDQVVVTQWVNLPAHSALSYWDKMALFVDDWLKSLPPEFAPVAERIAISVEWDI